MPLSDEQNANLTEAIAPIAESLDLELIKLDLVQEDSKRIFRITVDKEEGVGIYDMQKLSKRLSPLLDVEDPFAFEYTLEVSSPGIFRELLKEKDYKRFQGKRVQLKSTEEDTIVGTLIGLEEGQVVVDLDGITNKYELVGLTKVNLCPEI